MAGCLVDGCTRKHEARGLCKVHYNAAVRKGELVAHKALGRPRIYSDTERAERANKGKKRKYYEKVGYQPGQCPKKDKRKHPSYIMWANARARSRKSSLPFDLTLDDIITPDKCPLLGIPLFKSKGNYTDNSPTLDRLIPSLGYVKGNVWVVSMRANRLKQDATLAEIEMIYLNLKHRLQICL